MLLDKLLSLINPAISHTFLLHQFRGLTQLLNRKPLTPILGVPPVAAACGRLAGVGLCAATPQGPLAPGRMGRAALAGYPLRSLTRRLHLLRCLKFCPGKFYRFA